MESKKKMWISRRVFSVNYNFFHITLTFNKKNSYNFNIIKMILRGDFFIIILIIILLPLQSLALHPFYSFRYQQNNNNVEVSPLPSPSHQSCNGAASTNCRLNDVTACFIYSSLNGLHEEMGLFAQNNGENFLHVKIMTLPAKNTIKEIDLPSHQMMKINISSDVDISSGIILNTSNGDCVIHVAAPPPENHHYKFRSYTTYITPINGAYLVIILLIIGGILTFVKHRNTDRHLKGVPYHELEMGNSADLNLEENEKENENWDQDWDDSWGDENPVKYGGDKHVIGEQTNGSTIKMPNANRKTKDWDD